MYNKLTCYDSDTGASYDPAVYESVSYVVENIHLNTFRLNCADRNVTCKMGMCCDITSTGIRDEVGILFRGVPTLRVWGRSEW